MFVLCTKRAAARAALSLFLTACGREEEAVGAPATTKVSAAPSSKDMAGLGKQAFCDLSLSASGKLSCASCHSSDHAYGPPNGLAVHLGGSDQASRYACRALAALPALGAVLDAHDLPVKYQSNVDRRNAPMMNHKVGKPVWSEGDIRDVIAFLHTLNDSDAQEALGDAGYPGVDQRDGMKAKPMKRQAARLQ